MKQPDRKARCPHERVDLYERTEAELVWEFERGKLLDKEGLAGQSVPTGHITVVCRDCGLIKTYGLGRRPKWVEGLYQKVVNRSA